MGVFFYALSIWPLCRCWRTNRSTALVHAVGWGGAAWLTWAAAGLTAWPLGAPTAAKGLFFLALALTGCAGVAVLGARRPGAAAWNFVVGGLLAVLLLPLLENFILTGTGRLGGLRIAFLALTLAVGTGNYLPTGQAPAAILATAAWLLELRPLVDAGPESGDVLSSPVAWAMVGAVPLAAWWTAFRNARVADPLDRQWRDFRDRFGAIWALRARDQFNRAAATAGLPVVLGWSGFRRQEGNAEPAAIRQLLDAVLRRFGAEETRSAAPGQ